MKTEKVAQEDRISIEGTAPWLVVPSVLLLSATGRMFDIEVDAQSLPEGLSTAEVRGIDATAPWRGPLFRCLHAACVLFSCIYATESAWWRRSRKFFQAASGQAELQLGKQILQKGSGLRIRMWLNAMRLCKHQEYKSCVSKFDSNLVEACLVT